MRQNYRGGGCTKEKFSSAATKKFSKIVRSLKVNPIWIVMLNLRFRLSMCNYAHPYYLSFINEFLATNSTGDIRAHQEKA